MLFSDGEDQGGQGMRQRRGDRAAATIAQNAGVHIETVGVGTADGTTVEIDGYQVHTALDTEQLTAIAQATGGTLPPARPTRSSSTTSRPPSTSG